MNVAALRLPSLSMGLPVAWRQLGWKELRAASVGGVALLTFIVVLHGESAVFHGGDKGPNWVWIAIQLVKYEIWTFTLMLALVLADRAADEGRPRVVVYAMAIVGGCVLGIVVSTGWLALLTFMEDPPPPDRWRWLVFGAGWNLSTWLRLGGGIGFLYAEMRQARATRARLSRAELERASRARAALEARLQAMQARVEPRFLLDTLARIKQLYETNARRAEKVMDDLIAYLRSAMPQMRQASSTLGREIALARAYAAVLGDDATALDWEVNPALESARLPPMLLLPLVEQSLACGGSERTHVAVRARRRGDAVDVTVASDAAELAGAGSDAVLAALRERLATLYGPAAQLRVGHARGVEVTVSVPYETVAEAVA